MSKRGGQTNQSGIYYQNTIASLYMGRLCDSSERPQQDLVIYVCVETPDKVDDIVVTFADQHKVFIQAKENISLSDKAWRELWHDFEEEYFNDNFEQNHDFLQLHVGSERAYIRDLQEICERAVTSTLPSEWLAGLAKKQYKLLEKIKSQLSPRLWDEGPIFHFFKHIKVEIWTLKHIERDLFLNWMPKSNLTTTHITRLIRDRVGGEARRGGAFTASALRKSLSEEVKNLIFADAPDIVEIKQRIKTTSAVLHQHKNTWGQTGIHLLRPIANEIFKWLIRDELSMKENTGLLIDQAGMGKTVIMRDILDELEAAGVVTLALKADQQLSDASDSFELFETLFSPWSLDQSIDRLAKIGRVVILIDQIDALSLTLAHDEKALNVLLDKIAKLRRIPNVSILISCRLFDINSDPRLRQIESNRQFNLNRLSDDEISDVLSNVSIKPGSLSKATLELLSTPLHLSLFIQAIQSGWTDSKEIQGISSLQELYSNIWRFVIFGGGLKMPPEKELKEIIDFLTNYMNQEQKIIVPHSEFYKPEGQYLQNAKKWLASLGIIIESKIGWTFLHQTFFDYCYARNFVENGGNIVEEILHSPQGLFERSKVVQVFTYLRGFGNHTYLPDYEKLVGSPSLRFHLRDLLIRWFGSIPNPSEAERLFALSRFLNHKERPSYFAAMFGNIQWFDFLKIEILPRWLSTEDEFIDSYVILYLSTMVDIDQSGVIHLLEPYLDKGKKWQNRILTVIFRIQKWVTREAASLLVNLLKNPLAIDRYAWYEIKEVAKVYPDIGCQLIKLALNAALDEYVAKKSVLDGDSNPFRYVSLGGVVDQLDQVQLDEAIKLIADAEPRLLFDVLVEWFDKYYSLHSIRNVDPLSFVWDEFYDHWNEDLFQVRGAIIQSLISTAVFLAKNDSAIFRVLAARISTSPFATYQRLLARVYSLLPEQYAKDGLAFLLSDKRRLDLGSFDCLESRRLIRSIYPYLTEEERQGLEKQILSYDPIRKQHGIRGLNMRGLDQLYLLETIPPEMLTLSSKNKIRELRHKFPDYKAVDEESREEGGTVVSPIPEDIANKMSDNNWLSAMKKYKAGVSHRDFLKGGAYELSGTLSKVVKDNPARFYKILQQVPDDVDDNYVSAFINGFAEAKSEPECFFNTIRRFSSQPKRKISRTITWSIEKTSYEVPSDIIALLEDYLRGPIGDDELGWSKGENHLDVFNSYLNSERGGAFEALMHIWSKSEDSEALSKKWGLIEFVVSDSSSALRAGAIHWMTYLIKYDRDRAISLFEKMISGHDILLTLMTTREFIYWSFYKNYFRLSPYIWKMMESDLEVVQEQGAELACVAAISPSALESEAAIADSQRLAEIAIMGKTTWKRGAARIFSFNLTGRPKDVCEINLKRLMSETDEKVRGYIDGVFHKMLGEHFDQQHDFIEAYVQSSTKLNHFFADFLLRYGLQDPEWTLKIVKSTVEKMEIGQWDLGIEELIRLVLKIYMDPLSVKFREGAMDVFDILMVRYSGSAHKVLAEWDRV